MIGNFGQQPCGISQHAALPLDQFAFGHGFV